MYWKRNTATTPPAEVVIDADTDGGTFLFLTIKDANENELADVLLDTPADVDEFEREVTDAIAKYRALLAEPAT